MIDAFTTFFASFLHTEEPLLLMFLSAFLSATLLPGNSEIVFSALASQMFQAGNTPLLFLLLTSATFGNSLGSLTTYIMARLLPSPNFAKDPSKRTAWAIQFAQKYGFWTLLLSWLPLFGDLLCGVAGYLRLPLLPCAICIFLGKAGRYGMLAWGVMLWAGG